MFYLLLDEIVTNDSNHEILEVTLQNLIVIFCIVACISLHGLYHCYCHLILNRFQLYDQHNVLYFYKHIAKI
jgi:hypothetical protein